MTEDAAAGLARVLQAFDRLAAAAGAVCDVCDQGLDVCDGLCDVCAAADATHWDVQGGQGWHLCGDCGDDD
jgi:hypothetical protein